MIKVLFDLKKEYYFNSLYPLYKELANDSDYDLWINVGKDQKRFLGLFLISNKKRVHSELEKQGYKITDIKKGYDLIVCGDALKNVQNYDQNVPKIHLDHGVGIKTLRIRNIAKQKDQNYHVFLEGQYWYDYIKSVGMNSVATFYADTGIPKLDPFFWPDYYNKPALMQKFNLNPELKTVLFAPSYKPSCIEFVQEKITTLIPNYNLIIKLHPYSWGGKYVSHSQHTFYEKLAKNNAQVLLIDEHDYDIYPYLYIADTLISDTSSVINEFLALGKHGIIYVLPYHELNHSDGMPVLSIDPEKWLEGAFPHMYKPEDLLPAVEEALSPSPKMKEKLSEYRSYFFNGLDGQASRRVKEKVDALVKK